MQTLSFRPTTTASGVTPGVQKGSLDLQPTTHKARPSGGTVQQQASKPTQVAVTPTSVSAAAATAAASSFSSLSSSSCSPSSSAAADALVIAT